MNRKKNYLHDLINALSPSEIRYFKLFSASFSSEENMYLNFFKELKEEKSEHSNKILLKDKKAKSRLYEQLLKSERNYHQNMSVDINIQNMLCEIEILYSLNLFEQSVQILQKAHRKAVSNEKFGLVLQVIEWERKINAAISKPIRSIIDISIEEQVILKKYHQIIELENIFSRIREFKLKNGYAKSNLRDELEEIMSAPVLRSINDYTSQKASYYYNFIKALYHWLIFEHFEAIQYSKKLVDSSIKYSSPNDYMDGMLEHVTACICICNFQEGLEVLQNSEDYMREQKLESSHTYTVKMFYYRICYQLIIQTYIGNEQQLKNTIAECEEKFLLYKKMLSISPQHVILANLKNAYIALGNFEKAEEIMKEMFANKVKIIRGDIYDDMHFCRLFLTMQRGAFILLPSFALSAHRHFSKTKSDTNQSVDIKIIKLMLLEENYSSIKNQIALLHNIIKLLDEYIREVQVARNFQEYYSFYLLWARGILNHATILDEAKKASY